MGVSAVRKQCRQAKCVRFTQVGFEDLKAATDRRYYHFRSQQLLHLDEPQHARSPPARPPPHPCLAPGTTGAISSSAPCSAVAQPDYTRAPSRGNGVAHAFRLHGHAVGCPQVHMHAMHAMPPGPSAAGGSGGGG